MGWKKEEEEEEEVVAEASVHTQSSHTERAQLPGSNEHMALGLKAVGQQ